MDEIKEVNGKPIVGKPSKQPTIDFFNKIAPMGTVYDEDPYMTVYSFHEGVYSMYGKDLSMPDEEYGGSWIELIIGEERAMLIDTGFGIGSLKSLVDKLTGGMELIVVNTHSHADHSGGNSQFGKIYCHEYEAEELRDSLTMEHWLREDERFKSSANYSAEDILPFKTYDVVGCKNNTVFDLGGGHEVELIYLPGHTAGGCTYLDKKNRILFSGDAIMSPNQNLGFRSAHHPEKLTVQAYYEELVKLSARLDEFDCLYSGHRSFILDKSVVTDVTAACKDILEDPDCNEVYEMMMNHLVKIHQVGSIGMTYGDDQVR